MESSVRAVLLLLGLSSCAAQLSAHPTTGPIAHEAPSTGLSDCERQNWLEVREVLAEARSAELADYSHYGTYAVIETARYSTTVRGIGVTHPGEDELVALSSLGLERPKGALMERVRSRVAAAQVLLWVGLPLFTVATVGTVASASDGVTTTEAVLGLGGVLVGLVMLGSAVAVDPPARDKIEAGAREIALLAGEDDLGSAMKAIGRYNAGLGARCTHREPQHPVRSHGSSGVTQ
jgi:hypothetical protein